MVLFTLEPTVDVWFTLRAALMREPTYFYVPQSSKDSLNKVVLIITISC